MEMRIGVDAISATRIERMPVIKLENHRPPVCYTVRLTQHWDGRLEIFVEDIADDERSKLAIADALRRAADTLTLTEGK